MTEDLSPGPARRLGPGIAVRRRRRQYPVPACEVPSVTSSLLSALPRPALLLPAGRGVLPGRARSRLVGTEGTARTGTGHRPRLRRTTDPGSGAAGPGGGSPTMKAIPDRAAPAVPGRPLRLLLAPDRRKPGRLDGAWWPRSNGLLRELPALAAALDARWGRVTRITVNPAQWPVVPRRVPVAGHVVHAGWYTTEQDKHMVMLCSYGRRLDLLPPADGPGRRRPVHGGGVRPAQHPGRERRARTGTGPPGGATAAPRRGGGDRALRRHPRGRSAGCSATAARRLLDGATVAGRCVSSASR
ncbi:DUF5994 family protein [Kitasatospora sp. NPDC001540]|uniref:DUF5994 family protein n=1 Tax=Kitasatospora sp. NPDC001540 TaxID=3364014 RepID=UPI00368A5C32